jgi:hypothetical protein
MIDALLDSADWTEAPADMDFSCSYWELVRDIDAKMDRLAFIRAYPESMRDNREPLELSTALYLGSPGIVNVMLNYKICVEHDLPLHPTVYYELKEARKYRVDHGLPAIDKANRLYLRSIDLARSVCRLDSGFHEKAQAFLRDLPHELESFVYTGIRDRYTWRGSEPALLRRLAREVSTGFSPDILVAAAHGAIMPALLLSEYLGLPLYFIRFSMFKRHDEEPILGFSDKAWLSTWSRGKALLYDEDVAGGDTLSRFSRLLAPLFAESRTACSIRHAGASIRPDFIARTWWD